MFLYGITYSSRSAYSSTPCVETSRYLTDLMSIFSYIFSALCFERVVHQRCSYLDKYMYLYRHIYGHTWPNMDFDPYITAVLKTAGGIRSAMDSQLANI